MGAPREGCWNRGWLTELAAALSEAVDRLGSLPWGRAKGLSHCPVAATAAGCFQCGPADLTGLLDLT